MHYLKGKIKIHKWLKYMILSRGQSSPDLGDLIFQLLYEELDVEISFYTSHILIVDMPRVQIRLNVKTCQLNFKTKRKKKQNQTTA